MKASVRLCSRKSKTPSLSSFNTLSYSFLRPSSSSHAQPHRKDQRQIHCNVVRNQGKKQVTTEGGSSRRRDDATKAHSEVREWTPREMRDQTKVELNRISWQPLQFWNRGRCNIPSGTGLPTVLAVWISIWDLAFHHAGVFHLFTLPHWWSKPFESDHSDTLILVSPREIDLACLPKVS